MPTFQVVICPNVYIMYIPKRQSIIGHPPLLKGTRSACFKQCNARVNFWYMEESGGNEHFYLFLFLLGFDISFLSPAHPLSYVPLGRSGISSPVPAYLESGPEWQIMVSGLRSTTRTATLFIKA
ncbi:chlorate reductase subunit beta [Trichinella spiralis]|uniref:chlorate reductase subunit beta n=1 Tax=Trichinella spiralis TaxID=6334 RepID=UPI0001EFCD82|nr:chlorate reductase subunit beta [Trichinella spiralis]